jgi:diamine N-acetyltransferase
MTFEIRSLYTFVMTDESAFIPSRDSTVSLREITKSTVRTICRLRVGTEQEGYVANNAVSIAEAHFEPRAWFRGIYADDTPIGFVMLLDDPYAPLYYLWRFMVDARYQGLGFGHAAMEQVIEYVRTRPGAEEFTLSYVPGEHEPRNFYARLGFVETGREEHGEREMRLVLS